MSFRLSISRKALILHRIFPAGTNVLREPKVLMTLPNRLLCDLISKAVEMGASGFEIE